MKETKAIDKTALVVLSGGQDSVTCLGYALKMFTRVAAVSFKYGQRHAIELQCADLLCKKYSIRHHVVDLGSTLQSLVTSALVGSGDVSAPHAHKAGLPASFVPGRNALFLTLSHALAQELGAGAIITGVCQTDYSGYPDCRDEFIRAMQFALNTGYQTPGLAILTPLMHLTKGQTFLLADEMGWLTEVIENSHTCYEGDHDTKHEWGYGCGECPACLLRAKGWEEYKALRAQFAAQDPGSLVDALNETNNPADFAPGGKFALIAAR